MGVASFAPRRRSEQKLLRQLLSLARAALAWAFIGATVLLPLERLSQMSLGMQALQITIFVLCIGTSVWLLLPGADAVGDRS